VALITGTFYLIVRPLLGIDLSAVPEWAR